MTDARTLTLSLGGRWHGRYGAAPCPVCQPERRRDQTALTLADGRASLLLHCKRLGCDFRDIATAAGITPGAFAPPDPEAVARREAERRAKLEWKAGQARRLWAEALPITGTAAEAYLRRARGITCDLPKTLRFHPACWHGATARRYPALVALVEGGEGFAVHRTYLRPDGVGKAPIEPDKAMLGATAGGAVRLAHGPGWLVAGEGIESTLSLLSGLLDGPATAWATLSTSGMRALDLPPQPGRLTVACDGDEPGRAAAFALAERAHALGWTAGTLDPGDGLDWNDILTGKAVAA